MIVETARRLSESKIWALQRAYFEKAGVQAFASATVPHYITSNTVIADAYARLVLAYLVDQRATLDAAAPIYLVELGAGSGRFGFLFLRRLLALLERAGLGELSICYVLTDFAEPSIAAWAAHPQLQPYFAKGQLDLARYDAGVDQTIALRQSGVVLAPGALRNPLVVLANYCFDSIPIDLFQIRHGELHELAVTLEAIETPSDLDDPGLLARLRLRWEPRPAKPDYYGDAELDGLLKYYRTAFAETALRLPIGALRVLSTLRRLAGDRLLLLSADKGTLDLSLLDGQAPPLLTMHGSFSMNVNYHAIGEYLTRAGGAMLRPDHAHSSLAIVAAHLDPTPRALPALQLAYHTAVEQFGPDDYFLVRRAMEGQIAELSLDALLALLRLGRGEPRQLQFAMPTLRKKLKEATPAQKLEIERLVEVAWPNYFHIGEARDLGFASGVLLCDLGHYERAIARFELSNQWHPNDSGTHYNLGLCHRRLNQIGETRRHARAALAIDPTHAGARQLLDDLPFVE